VICGGVNEGSVGAKSVHPVNTTAPITRRIVITPAQGNFKIHHPANSGHSYHVTSQQSRWQADILSALTGTMTAYCPLAQACIEIEYFLYIFLGNYKESYYLISSFPNPGLV
jgi:hypothetical protein